VVDDPRRIVRSADQEAATDRSGVTGKGATPDLDAGNATARHAAADARDATAAARDQVADARDRAAGERDSIANARGVADREGAAARETVAAARDTMAAARDETASARDTVAAARDETAAVRDTVAAARDETATERLSIADARVEADREQAATDRSEVARERAVLESELERAHLDELTGAYRREMGRIALTHEIDRARRGDGRFVIAFVDVDGMKSVNDRDGHAAGDRVLVTLVTRMRANLRSFDPIVRYGGDEFICGLGGADLEDVERRFAAIGEVVKRAVNVGISVGLAALLADETLDQLTARADAALLGVKGRRPVQT
jgi:diguanylate cyclase (GGDEF)-like protein